VREVTVPFTSTPLPDGAQCRSDEMHQRALFRLEPQGPWPAASGPRAREVQLVVAAGEIEIEHANIAMVGGGAAATVAQQRRAIVRKWLFSDPITAPVAIVVCVRSTTGQAPQPAFSISTWREVAP
jgi:hypothetical protein